MIYPLLIDAGIASRKLSEISSGYLAVLLRNSALLVGAAIASFFKSALVYSFAIGAAAQYGTVVVVEVVTHIDKNFMISFNLKLTHLHEKYPFLPQIVLIAQFVIYTIFPFLSLTIFLVYGIYSGLINRMLYYKLQHLHSTVNAKNPLIDNPP